MRHELAPLRISHRNPYSRADCVVADVRMPSHRPTNAIFGKPRKISPLIVGNGHGQEGRADSHALPQHAAPGQNGEITASHDRSDVRWIEMKHYIGPVPR